MSLTDEQIEEARISTFKQCGADLRPEVTSIFARAIESAATAPLLERIQEMEESERSSERARVKLCSIHQYQKEALIARIAALEQQLEAALKDAERWRAMRKYLVGVDFQPEMGGSPVVFFECFAVSVSAGESGADAIADAAISKEQA